MPDPEVPEPAKPEPRRRQVRRSPDGGFSLVDPDQAGAPPAADAPGPGDDEEEETETEEGDEDEDDEDGDDEDDPGADDDVDDAAVRQAALDELRAAAPSPPPAPKRRSRPRVARGAPPPPAVSARQQALLERRAADERRPRRPAPPPRGVHTPDDDLPIDADPSDRDFPTISEIEPEDGTDFPDLAGRQPPQTLADLCALYPIGNGQHYIRVERIRPPMYMNVPCAGYLGEIKTAVTEKQFATYYGGGRYVLRVYGPDPRGSLDRVSSLPIVKALTKPITLTVPGVPNLDLEILQEEAMTAGGWDPTSWGGGTAAGRFRRQHPPSPADATIHGQGLDFASKMLSGKEREIAELRRQGQQSQGVVEPVIGAMKEQNATALGAVKDLAGVTERVLMQQVDSLKQELAELRSQLRDENRKPSETAGAWDVLGKAITQATGSRGNSEDLNRLHSDHREEMNRLYAAHNADTHRLEETHKRELDNVRSTYDQRISTLQSQLEERERRHRDEIEDWRKRMEDRERQLRDEADKREREMTSRHDSELKRQGDQHARDLANAERQTTLVVSTEKSQLEGRIQGLKDRIEVLKEELERTRREADEKDDLEGQLGKAERTAQMLGYSKLDEAQPKTWQDRLAAAVAHGITNLPQILDSAGKTLQARARAQIEVGQHEEQMQRRQGGPGGPGQPQQRRQIRGPGGQPIAMRRTVFATDDGTPLDVNPEVAAQAAARHPFVSGSPSNPAPPPPQQPAPQPPESAPPSGSAPTQPAPAAPPPEPRPPNGAVPAEPMNFDPAELEVVRNWAETALEADADPVAFAATIIQQAGLPVASRVFGMITPDMIVKALAETPATAASPLVRREGTQWLKKVWAAGQQLIEQAMQQPGMN